MMAIDEPDQIIITQLRTTCHKKIKQQIIKIMGLLNLQHKNKRIRYNRGPPSYWSPVLKEPSKISRSSRKIGRSKRLTWSSRCERRPVTT